MSDYPMLISNKLHSFRNFLVQKYVFLGKLFVTLPINLMNSNYKSLNI